MEKILIVDDNSDLRHNLSDLLKEEGYDILTAKNGKLAIREIKNNSPDLVLLDMRLPDMDGLQILEKIKEIDKSAIVIMLTAYADIKDSVNAMKSGAFDYLTKPFDNEELLLVIKRALQNLSLNNEVQRLREKLKEKKTKEDFMGNSSHISKVLKQVEIVAPTDMTVILQGESGTGKELIAQMIHQNSLRKNKPFIAIDCGAIPEPLIESELFGYEKGAFTGAAERKTGEFERANGGTLFLDEITNLPVSMQAKLLRVIQERKLQHLGGNKKINIDARMITATNVDFRKAVKAGQFREDLFYRLNEFHIKLPTLRERQEDIPILIKYFLDEANREFSKTIRGVSGNAMKLFLDYHWPGNIRELKNVVRKATLLSNSHEITPDLISLDNADSSEEFHPDQNQNIAFKHDLDDGASLKEITQKVTKTIEKDVIKQILTKVGGNKSKAAKMLKIDRVTLYSKMKEFSL
ncbi:MAG: sigma-54 dependent transcriptional regulator [Candidatus Theseobacter exili]|nr:sigma-54 dependent transcriptional regulator [Candidatus Theseobacter exili]